MSIFHYGAKHDWFAWHPVKTQQHGWKWLTKLTRYKCHVDVPGSPTFWCYEPKESK